MPLLASLIRVWGDFVRRFLVLTLIILMSCLLASAEAIAAEERLIAVIMANAMPRYQNIHTTFVENSQSFCDQDCKIYVQTPNADVMSLRNSVRKAVALGADLIVTYGTSASLAAKAESPPMPTLFADAYDPVNLQLVSKETQSGRNMTGIRGDAPVQALFKYFVEAANPKKLVVLYDLNSPEGDLQKSVLQAAGKMRGVAIVPLSIEAGKDHASFLKFVPSDADGLFLANSDHDTSQLSDILTFASERQLPVITQRAGMSDQGAFMVLETSDVEQGKQLADMATQIFSGKKVADIPMYKPHQVGFIINLKVSKEYDLHVPFQTLSIATRIVR